MCECVWVKIIKILFQINQLIRTSINWLTKGRLFVWLYVCMYVCTYESVYVCLNVELYKYGYDFSLYLLLIPVCMYVCMNVWRQFYVLFVICSSIYVHGSNTGNVSSLSRCSWVSVAAMIMVWL